MNDREVIARAIGTQRYGTDRFATMQQLPGAHAMSLAQAYRDADAVLAAIGDRLLPELPDWADNVAVTLWCDQPDGRGLMKFIPHQADGTGATIPDAIRNALEGGS